MQLQLLGQAAIITQGTLQPLPLARPTWLLLYLALRADWVARDELACLLRPEDDLETARNATRLIFHRAKQTAWANTLEIETKRARLLVNTDVHSFLTHYKQRNWLDALEVYQGTLIKGFLPPPHTGLEAWLEFERESLHNKWREAILHRTTELETTRAYGVAIGWLEKLLHSEPLCEEAIQGLIRCHLALKNRVEAEKIFKRFSSLLEQEIGIQPDANTLALFDSARAESPIVVSSGILPMIGREVELEQIKTWLVGTHRLVSIVGIGGSGKTRLAIETARMLRPEFVHGTGFIDGTALSQSNQFLPALAASLNIPNQVDQSLEQSVLSFLKEKAMLIVLDNMEHLLETSGLIVQLLSNSEHLRILVTSRVRLGVNDETILDLRGLPVPKNPLEIPTNQAVRLFQQVAGRLTKQQLQPQHIATIVSILEGMPLAIELAARWSRVLSLPQIISQLEKSQLWLETDTNDVPERHRSLEAVLYSTWKQLNLREQQALEALTVFRGGASLEALQVVGQTQLPTLLALINKGLIYKNELDRFTCHEMIREFSSLQTQQLEQLQLLHWQYFYTPLIHIDGTYRPADLPKRYKHDLENLIVAWHWRYRHGDYLKIEQILNRWVFVFEVHGWFQSAVVALVSANQHLRALGEHQTRAELLRAEAYFNHYFDKNLAKQAIQESIEIFTRLNNYNKVIESYLKLGEIERALGHFETALEHYLFAASLPTVDSEQTAKRLDPSLSEVYRCLGKYEQALFHANRYTNAAMAENSIENIGRGYHALGLIEMSQQHHETAERYFQKSQVEFEKLDFKEGILSCLSNIAICQVGQDLLEQAQATVMATIALKEKFERPAYVEFLTLSSIFLSQNQFHLALKHSLKGCQLALEFQEMIFVFDGLKNIALILQRINDPLGKELMLQILQHPSAVAEIKTILLETWHEFETREPWEVDLIPIPELLRKIEIEALPK